MIQKVATVEYAHHQVLLVVITKVSMMAVVKGSSQFSIPVKALSHYESSI